MKLDSIQKEKIFLAKSFNLISDTTLEIYFDKEVSARERYFCFLRVAVDLGSIIVEEYEKFRFVTEDKITSIDNIIDCVTRLLNKVTKSVDAIDSGIEEVEVAIPRELIRKLHGINRKTIEPVILDLYSSILIHHKGTDTLQKKKFERMVEAQMDAMVYYKSGGNNA